jgi:hypothetical protein
MLKDNYIFRLNYDELAMFVAHLKALQQRAVITPHNRKEGKSLELLLCGILRKVAKRLDAQLFDWKYNVKIKLKREEALAFHCAYKYGWIPNQVSISEIFETIDKVI